ncbi:hypothetical protein FHR33_008898 [Nonomuraea dietziae]|uniref:Uncharacterized protein n=1 Tax=Nonomuraea dietziae TaxID=65515 RepID=A0A7W5YCZ7_9ACTN|nr:hypothetical protein [Nonomuraea dietziae]
MTVIEIDLHGTEADGPTAPAAPALLPGRENTFTWST